MATNRFVRKSKFRHVFAVQPKRDVIYDGINMTKNAWDSNFISVSPTWIAVAWQVGGGGAVGCVPVDKPGKHDNVFLFTGHKGAVLDLQMSPFHDNLVATVSEDCYAKLWTIPDGGLTANTTEASQTLRGHTRKVGVLEWNGVAENVLATGAQDFNVKIWDVATGQDKLTVPGHGGIIQSISWDYSGKLMATSCKDKKLRVIDPRTGAVSGEVQTHEGVKGGRAIWLGKHDKILSVGFAKTSERQYFVFDPRNLSEPIVGPVTIDNSAGMIMPFYDEDTELLFLAGKGDGNIRYYEVEPDNADPKEIVHYVSQYGSNESTRGCAVMPKRGCDVNTNEVVRMYKVTGLQIQPLSFKVPRKSDMFQEDIFPDCRSDEAALTADQWFDGETVDGPKLKKLEGGFAKKENSSVNFQKQEEEKEMSHEELKKAYEELKRRVAYLEAELAKAGAK